MSIVSLQVTQNDMIMAERLFGILAHVASSELPQYRLISILGDARWSLISIILIEFLLL